MTGLLVGTEDCTAIDGIGKLSTLKTSKLFLNFRKSKSRQT